MRFTKVLACLSYKTLTFCCVMARVALLLLLLGALAAAAVAVAVATAAAAD